MTYDGLAALKVSDLTRPTSAGETVNAHVVPAVREPAPDFDAMRRVIEGQGAQSQDGRSKPEEVRALPAV
jgi:hypothetical protein